MGELYTIEGIAAGILMITTAYLILSTTSIFTVGDTHISDMQLEQLGNDALAVMDFPDTYQGTSPLESYIWENSSASKSSFNTSFLKNLTTTNGKSDPLKYTASVYFSNSTGVHGYPFHSYGTSTATGREHMVRATRFVYLPNPPINNTLPEGMMNRDQAVLFEVLIWRD